MNHQTSGKQEFPNRETLEKRARLNQNIRQFFTSAGYLEVETPILSPTVIPETSIDYFAADFTNEFIGSRELYLLPSPEIYMKRLLARGMGNLFQIGKCFRNGEELGRLHNPEFSMLEWYTVQADYEDSIALTREFLQQLPIFSDVRGTGEHEDIFKPLEVISMVELIHSHAGFDLSQYQSTPKLYEKAKELGLLSSSQSAAVAQGSPHPSPGSSSSSSSSAAMTSSASSYTWEELFNLIFVSLAEPRIPSDHPVIIKDYPKKIRCLAKDRPGTPWSERWELYLHGTELANCYSEETDPIKVGEYFEEAAAALAARRSFSNKAVPDIDLHYKDLYTDRHPPCSGTALGIDRLLMELTGIDDIGGVMLFPLTDRD